MHTIAFYLLEFLQAFSAASLQHCLTRMHSLK